MKQKKDIECEYLTTLDYNKFTNNILDAEITEKKLFNGSDIADFVKKTDFYDQLKILNKKFASNKAKHVVVENELDELSKKIKPLSKKGIIYCWVEHIFLALLAQC